MKQKGSSGLLGSEPVRVVNVSFLPFLDLPLLMVDTWSSTRWCPERCLPSEGSASEVSSTAKFVIADFSGSAALIFPSSVPSFHGVPKVVLFVFLKEVHSEKCGSTRWKPAHAQSMFMREEPAPSSGRRGARSTPKGPRPLRWFLVCSDVIPVSCRLVG